MEMRMGLDLLQTGPGRSPSGVPALQPPEGVRQLGRDTHHMAMPCCEDTFVSPLTLAA